MANIFYLGTAKERYYIISVRFIVILNNNEIFFCLKYFHSKKHLSQSKVKRIQVNIDELQHN